MSEMGKIGKRDLIGNMTMRRGVSETCVTTCVYMLGCFISNVYLLHRQDEIVKDCGTENVEGCMLVPIILGSDKTTTSVGTGQHEYYPLYMSIGNLFNSTRRAHKDSLMLVAFLAIPKCEFIAFLPFRVLMPLHLL